MKANLVNLKNIFSQMLDDGIETNSKFLWSFYFCDKRKSKIQELNKIFLLDKHEEIVINKRENGYWRLKVSFYRKYTPELLHKQNVEYNKMVEKHDVQLYDGWEVDV